MKAAEPPGRAQETAMPRSVVAARQRYSSWTLQEDREAPLATAHRGLLAQAATTPRPTSQPIPVTRRPSVPATVVSPQLCAEAPGGAAGVVAVAVGAGSSDEPQPTVQARTTRSARAA
jgi:hypothetical protein